MQCVIFMILVTWKAVHGDISIRGLIENCGNRGQKLQRNKGKLRKDENGKEVLARPSFSAALFHLAVPWSFLG